MLEIQSLTVRVQELQTAFNFWNKWHALFVAITLVVVIAFFYTQFMSIRKGRELAGVQATLAVEKDRQLSRGLKEKDEKIAEANARAAKALLALKRFKEAP